MSLKRPLGIRFFVVVVAAFAIGLVSPARSFAQVLVKDGQTIAFLGDSITQEGVGRPSGYVRFVISGLEANGIHAKMIPAGISGNKSDQMLARLKTDVLDKKPDWMTLSCGVNDAGHGVGVPLDAYQKNITSIVDQCQAAGIQVLILTATMISEDQSGPNNQKLVGYNDFLRQLAKEKNCPLADLNADMQQALKQPDGAPPAKGNRLTLDGVHMNAIGNQMMAAGMLRGFGLDDAGLAKAKALWLDVPSSVDLPVRVWVTIRQYEALTKIADAQNLPVPDLLKSEMEKAVQALLKDQPASGTDQGTAGGPKKE